MSLQRHEIDALVDLVKSWPGMDVIECTSEPPAPPDSFCIATSTEWPEALKEKVFERWPELRNNLCDIVVRNE
jgi:hypothetical protein